MAAEEGNKYAEKYSPDDIIFTMDEIFDGLKNGTVSSIHEAYIKEGIYSSLVASWKKTHENNADVLTAIKRVSEMGHEVLRSNMLLGTVNSTAAIWIDKTVYKTKEQPVEENKTIVIRKVNSETEE
ncbi:MAG: hypothetical protein GY799_32610 [Desulfobulbaceae bacterium]|nr:hypothetical protein [Desulfobulbaceae bacterium]